jgi:uncharacterized protein (TIRG00374 family)
MFSEDFLRIELDFDPTSVFFAVLLVFASIVPRVYRWLLLMKSGADGISVTFWDSFKITLVGLALNIISPAGSGDVLKSYYGYQWTGVKERMVAVSLYDKLIAILSLGLIAVVGFLCSFSWSYLIAASICISIFLLLTNPQIILLASRVKLLEKINEKTLKLNFVKLSSGLKFSKTTIFSTISLSLFAWLIDFVFLYYCLQWSGVNLIINEAIFNGAILKLGKLFPFTLNGMGTDELIMGFLFANDKSEVGLVLIASVLYRIMIDVFPALLGVVFILTGKKRLNE